ncbi:hypothetical protein C8J57DRAFT_1233657 [Mycena rebaudengoi]|nr:hypothetical protein C8J57DRAFT_1233657 [Mycena rebaudengoi]
MLAFAQSLHLTVEVLFIAVHLPSGDHGYQLCSLSAKAYGRLQSEFERRSLGQKKRRQRESKENQSNPKGSKQMNRYRSAAQRARRQRELAANIDLKLKYYEGKLKKERGVWSQTLIVILHKLWTEHLIMNMM